VTAIWDLPVTPAGNITLSEALIMGEDCLEYFTRIHHQGFLESAACETIQME
jgi:hypothetical protein